MARHRAGINLAIYKVYGPLVFAGAAILISIFASRLLGYEGGYGNWLPILLGCISIGILAGGPIAYFVARNNRSLIRKELEKMVDDERWALPMYQKSFTGAQQMLRDFPQELCKLQNEVWEKTLKHVTATYICDIEKAIQLLREKYLNSSPEMKIKEQEHFLWIQQVIRSSETALKILKDPGLYKFSKEGLRVETQISLKEIERWKKLIEKEKDHWQMKINISEKNITDAQRAIKGLD